MQFYLTQKEKKEDFRVFVRQDGIVIFHLFEPVVLALENLTDSGIFESKTVSEAIGLLKYVTNFECLITCEIIFKILTILKAKSLNIIIPEKVRVLEYIYSNIKTEVVGSFSQLITSFGVFSKNCMENHSLAKEYIEYLANFYHNDLSANSESLIEEFKFFTRFSYSFDNLDIIYKAIVSDNMINSFPNIFFLIGLRCPKIACPPALTTIISTSLSKLINFTEHFPFPITLTGPPAQVSKVSSNGSKASSGVLQ
ncbi:hypothetical protein BpHYR1_006675 [Brachionus plicatilis]|uniref:Uncharacterized protein n=1 Tax=Brachionus plicatilis TaxID=10195 RepID=A0A3M7QPW3_BRAPC|nr:hypothetical protein BpHYR1_006675 [Brachionus plicatilis]